MRHHGESRHRAGQRGWQADLHHGHADQEQPEADARRHDERGDLVPREARRPQPDRHELGREESGTEVLGEYDPEVASDPAAFSGTITVTGVTYGYSRQDPNIFGIMDVKELQCQSPNCNKLILPVKYQGKMPAGGDEITMTGSFVNIGGGYLFAAEQIKVLRNHKLGGQG
jgi:hypothetical protein